MGTRSNRLTIYVLSKNKKNIFFCFILNYHFSACENRCILHGHVCVMKYVHCNVKIVIKTDAPLGDTSKKRGLITVFSVCL